MKRDPVQDLLAGLTVAVVALPLALAFGAISGLGARSGIITAVIAGLVAAIFGGSNLQVSGPTGAMTVVLVPVVHAHGVDGALMVGLLAGIALVAAGWLGFGKYVRFLPVSVIEGFTAGIAVTIILQQAPAMLGTAGRRSDYAWEVAFTAFWEWLHHPVWAPVILAHVVAAVILAAHWWKPTLPWSLIVLAAATAAASLGGLPVETLGAVPAGLPTPSAQFIHLDELGSLVPAALAVAALAALESLLCATVADSMTGGEHHNPDRELVGQGLANLTVPFFGGVPATAAIARTAVNVRAGARSRTAAAFHAIALLLLVSVFAGAVSQVPMAALAGVLVATAVQMVDLRSTVALARSTRGDAIVLILTFAVTVVLNLVDAVGVGMIAAMFLALQAISRAAHVEEVEVIRGDSTDEEHELLKRHIAVYRIDGPLFFADAHRFLVALREVPDVRVVVLRMTHVTTIDATGAHALDDVVSQLEARGKVVMISGIHPDHDAILARLSVADHLRARNLIHQDLNVALNRARELVDEIRA
jgi:SulP family sulfate permease